MTQRTFHYKELLHFGWEKTKAQFWFLTVVLVLLFGLSAVFGHVPVVGALISIAIGIAFISLLLDIASGHTPTYKDALKPFRTYHVFFHYILAVLMVALFCALGLAVVALASILFGLIGGVVSGIVVGVVLLYYMVRIQFYKYLIVEHAHMTPLGTFKKSMQMTEGHFWFLVGFMLSVIVINILGALLLGIGLFLSIPVTSIAYTHLYKKLSASA